MRLSFCFFSLIVVFIKLLNSDWEFHVNFYCISLVMIFHALFIDSADPNIRY